MKKILLLMAAAVLGLSSSDACTSIIVGKKASADGSVMTTYNCDSYGTFHPLYHYAAGKHKKGTMRDVIDRDSRVYHGQIAEAEETYNVIGDINEWQVSIGETTFGGRHEMIDTTGILDYGSLMAIALQRSKTAREAIQVMTSLADQYGYCSSGESFSICDPNEAWIMEMVGCGPGSKKVAWVALRVPDEAICVHANQSRIGKFNMKDKQNVLYSKNVVSYARSQGWFKGKDEDFSFNDAYNEPDFGGRRYCDARVWTIYRKFADGFDRYLPYVEGKEPLDKVERMPLWIIPNRKLSVQDVQMCLRDHYEGTALAMDNDMGQGLYESPFRPSPLKFTVDGKDYFNERPVATMQTAFTWISQLRSWLPREVGGVLWWANDDGDVAVYTPIYCGNTVQPRCYNTPGADAVTFSMDNAYWVENWVGNMVYPRYSLLYPSLKAVRDSLETSYFANQTAIENHAMALLKADRGAALKFLNNYSNEVAEQMLARWKELATYLIVKFNDGIVREEENGRYKMSKTGFHPVTTRPGYPAKIAKKLVESTGDKFAIPAEKK
ncbi:MAG: C69 family dipeptidase [Muribaculaceae bacterium]|nr:C69 family dipeptidase [Muribaculaceae bacterium]MBQ1723264.1 C69 family dipeptidase [Muribaculaceae bacterium]MBQ2490821.1 C69 family dipeptidase [Muribaculaceae bacterium]MBQ4007429.1 C69 family dipeptidase [Muribaculaceae bacterium]